MTLSLLLDNADPAIWGKWFRSGIFHGITTNPTLLKEAGQPCNLPRLKLLAQEAQKIGCKELHIQAWGQTTNEIVDCGISIGNLSTPQMHVFVKIPITKTGSEAAKELIKSNTLITFTACYEAKQVLIASSLGANYLAPYLGRIDDQGKDGAAELLTMQKILEGTCSTCKILVASIRDSSQINYLASKGISTFTINERIAKDLFKSKLTIEAAINLNKTQDLVSKKIALN